MMWPFKKKQSYYDPTWIPEENFGKEYELTAPYTFTYQGGEMIDGVFHVKPMTKTYQIGTRVKPCSLNGYYTVKKEDGTWYSGSDVALYGVPSSAAMKEVTPTAAAQEEDNE